MSPEAPFTIADLEELDELLFQRADRVVPMSDISRGDIGRRVIGLRHDVDDNKGSFDTALAMARWEFDHGYSSTYFLLHDSHYWGEDMLCRAVEFEDLGHEVGIHVNAVAEGLRQDRDPRLVLAEALSELRSAVKVTGCVAHGDRLCYSAGFVNDEMFAESPRPSWGPPGRLLRLNGTKVRLSPVPRATFGLSYDANWLPKGDYLSDSGGRWSQPVDEVSARFGEGQLHMLIHPDWWKHAFVGVRA